MRVLDLRLFLDKWREFVPIEGEFVPERKKAEKSAMIESTEE